MAKGDMNGTTPHCPMDTRELETLKQGFSSMEKQVSELYSRLEPLEYLPKIANTLETLTDKLVKPATDKTIFFVIMGGLMIMLVVMVLKDSDKTFKLNHSGFEMNNGNSPR